VFNSFGYNEEGTCVNDSIKTKKLVAIFLVTLFLTALVSPFLHQTYAAPTELTISPTEGLVGTYVNVDGTIDTTNGTYRIFFDSTQVNNGTADNAGRVASFFKVPHTTNGTHTITLHDVTASTNDTKNFTVETAYYIQAINLPQSPSQLQEGAEIEIQANITGGNPSTVYQRNITVTRPASANPNYYNATLPLLTDQNGTASNTLIYPRDFLPAGAHTNYTGTYMILLYENATVVGAENFFVLGLTNATLYQRSDWVNIKAINYTKPNENATVTIKLGNTNLLSQVVSAVNGIINYNWQIPVNASKGSYKVTVATAIQNGTVKPIPDAQNFTLPGLSVNILTTNLSGESVGGVNATVYETVQNTEVTVASGLTNSSGWIAHTLDRGGNYSFKAFWKNVQVNTTSVYISSNSSWTLTCEINHIAFTVIDEKYLSPMPFIFLTLTVEYLDANNTIVTDPQQNFVTNGTGKWILRNQLVDANYTIRAYRTQLLFFNVTFTPAKNQWYNMSIVCPLRDLTVHAEDAKQTALVGYPIKIYEFAGGLYANSTTDSAGNVTFSAVFGIYKVRLYNPEETIVLNETYYTLVNASAFFILRSDIYHANLSVKIVDYFGQPMANIQVKLERQDTTPITLNTGGNGIAFFGGITGGDCFVSVYLGSDTPSATATVLVEKDTTLTITLGRHVSIFGLIVDTSQFAILIIFIVLIVLFIGFLFYRRRNKASAEKKAEKES
jgi:hypothetical protein